MSLLDQLRLLDRALRDVRVREALRTGDRGGRRLARFAGSVAPADLAVLRAVDARRFEAVAQRQAEMIRDRWWTPRFPGTLAGAARAIQATTRDVALGVLASASYDKREGEDETGAALLGFVLGREDRSEDPAWLQDLLAYEYLVAVGLPRRSRAEKLDLALEQRLLPEGTRFIEPLAKKAAKGKAAEISLARKVIALPLEYPASDIRESLRTNQDVPDEIEPEPHVVVFVLEPEAATELRVPAVGHDVLDMVMAAPIEGKSLLEAFGADRVEVYSVLEALIDSDIVAGARPARPEDVERDPDDEAGAWARGQERGPPNPRARRPPRRRTTRQRLPPPPRARPPPRQRPPSPTAACPRTQGQGSCGQGAHSCRQGARSCRQGAPPTAKARPPAAKAHAPAAKAHAPAAKAHAPPPRRALRPPRRTLLPPRRTLLPPRRALLPQGARSAAKAHAPAAKAKAPAPKAHASGSQGQGSGAQGQSSGGQGEGSGAQSQSLRRPRRPRAPRRARPGAGERESSPRPDGAATGSSRP